MIAVTRPTSHLWIRKAKGIFATSIAIWCSSLAMAIPEAIYSTDTWSSVNHTICGMSFPKNSSSEASVKRWYSLVSDSLNLRIIKKTHLDGHVRVNKMHLWIFRADLHHPVFLRGDSVYSSMEADRQ
jgi:hypothetical protein